MESFTVVSLFINQNTLRYEKFLPDGHTVMYANDWR